METVIKLIAFVLCMAVLVTLVHGWSMQVQEECRATKGTYFKGRCIHVAPTRKGD